MLYNEQKIYNDVEKIFANEDYMDILDWIPEENNVSMEIYYTGWCGKKAFDNKLNKYAKRLEKLGYNIKVIKDIHDENDGLYEHQYLLCLLFLLNTCYYIFQC